MYQRKCQSLKQKHGTWQYSMFQILKKTICPEKLGILNIRTKFKAICTQVELHILESMKYFHIICCFLYKNPYLVYSTVILKGVTYISWAFAEVAIWAIVLIGVKLLRLWHKLKKQLTITMTLMMKKKKGLH